MLEVFKSSAFLRSIPIILLMNIVRQKMGRHSNCLWGIIFWQWQNPFLCGTHQLNTGNVYCGALSGRVSLPKPLDWLTNWGTVLDGCHKLVPKYHRMVKACVGCLNNVSLKFCTEENHHNLQTLAGLKVCPAFPFHLLELRIACSADWTAKSDVLNLAKEQSGAIEEIETAFFATKKRPSCHQLHGCWQMRHFCPTVSHHWANWLPTQLWNGGQRPPSLATRPPFCRNLFPERDSSPKIKWPINTLHFRGSQQKNKKNNPWLSITRPPLTLVKKSREPMQCRRSCLLNRSKG